MKDGRQDVSMDRWLMRVKDLILIAGILWSGFKYIYLKPLELEGKIDRLENQVNQIVSELKVIHKNLNDGY